MTAYYNENAPEAAAWLRELIHEGLIAPGHVDERSIAHVRPIDLAGFTQCHFFAGIGGWSLALRSANWPDHRPVWTGSCPCQPFSLAGKQRGFDDERHLWPFFRYLIAQRHPAVVFGEQVASASQWLGLVRGDLEAMEYAVGAMPVEAASAGADHLRDRFWFVADDGSGRCTGPQRRQSEQPRRAETVGAGDSSRGYMAHAHDTRSQGRLPESERADQRTAGPNGVAYTTGERGTWRTTNTKGTPRGNGAEINGGISPHATIGADFGSQSQSKQRVVSSSGSENNPFEWVIGADGKARRVKPGIRLLAHGISGRVGLLRGFGNAIDPRPAVEFIKAAQETIDGI